MFCKYCGAQMPDGAKFCPECGIDSQDRRCIRCAKPLPYGARYCDKCGELVADQHWLREDTIPKSEPAKNNSALIILAVLYVILIVVFLVLEV